MSLEIVLGFSKTVGGFGSGLALVYRRFFLGASFRDSPFKFLEKICIARTGQEFESLCVSANEYKGYLNQLFLEAANVGKGTTLKAS